jgi:hypothetical protein
MVSLEAVCWPLGASAIVPEEFNCLLNPFHEDFRFEWFSGPELYPVDPCLLIVNPA